MKLLQGDCLEVLRAMPENSVDSIVTDPPYGWRFMGKAWDMPDINKYITPPSEEWHETNGQITEDGRRLRIGHKGAGLNTPAQSAGTYDTSITGNQSFQKWTEQWAREAFRVLKPGGHALIFCGPRTYHRMATGVEDAGFEIRDQLQWIFGQGFPKSLNLKDALPGFGTALKPANEPIVLARKPISEKTVAANVLKWGTGGINVDGCRVECGERPHIQRRNDKSLDGDVYGSGINGSRSLGVFAQGRFPANVLLDEDAGKILDEQSGITSSKSAQRGTRGRHDSNSPHTERRKDYTNGIRGHDDHGGASRFFYCAKASKRERNLGLESRPTKKVNDGRQTPIDNAFQRGETQRLNTHPTVKPIALMSYLCRLITPPNGTVLDPFMGSGSTGVAALKEGFDFIGIEKEPEYLEIARARIAHHER